jgi:hypothetical protein
MKTRNTMNAKERIGLIILVAALLLSLLRTALSGPSARLSQRENEA